MSCSVGMAPASAVHAQRTKSCDAVLGTVFATVSMGTAAQQIVRTVFGLWPLWACSADARRLSAWWDVA